MKKIISIILALVLTCSAFCVTSFASTRKLGDADNNDKISATDALMILQHVAGINTIADVTNLDVSQDEKLSASDARVILQVVAGIVDIDTIEQLKMFVDSFNNKTKTSSDAVNF